MTRHLFLPLCVAVALTLAGAAAATIVIQMNDHETNDALSAGQALSVPAGSDDLIVIVETGHLPRGGALVLETANGAKLGSVSQFGLTAAAADTQLHTLRVPRSVLSGDTVRVKGRIVFSDVERAATASEFIGIRIAD